MPAIGFGTYKLADPEQSVIDAIKSGYRLIDTAQKYANEEYVGNAVKKCGVDRRELFITTKLWFKNFEKEDALRALGESFRRLKLDYIDMVLLHWPYGNVYSAWRVLEDFYAAGKIRAIGVSNFDPDRMIDLIHNNKIRPCVNQIETHLYCQRQAERPWLEKYGVAHQAYSPLARGRTAQMLASGPVTQAAAAHGKTPAQIALRFLVQNGICPIPKSSGADRIKENIDIFDFSLTDSEMSALRALDEAAPIYGFAQDPEKVETAMNW